MANTKEQQDQDQAEFNKQFAAGDEDKSGKTEAEEFGLDSNVAAGAGGGQQAATAAVAAPAEVAPAAANAGNVEQEQRLAQREADLSAKEAAFKEKELAMSSSNVSETQSGNQATEPGAGAESEDDPAAALAEDFGPEFVTLLTRLIEKHCKQYVGEGVGGVTATVDSLIRELGEERQTNHFNRIREAHGDFEELTKTPEFSAWQEAQPPADKSQLAKVIASGSAAEIIAMLTKFKAEQGAAGEGDSSNDEQLDNAEGVRSSALKLPQEPSHKTSYQEAWDES